MNKIKSANALAKHKLFLKSL